MKSEKVRIPGIVAVVVAGALAVVGCGKKSETAGIGERTGVALDNAVDKTVEVATNVAAKTGEAAKDAAVATEDVAGQVVEKTGEVMGKAGTAVEKTGADMQK